MFLTKKKSKLSVQNIVTINAYRNKYYLLNNNAFNPLKKLKYNTSNFIVSYLSNKDMITTVVYLSRSIPEEDIADILDIKAYEELGLDQASAYVISSFEVENENEEREFHIFVAEPSVLDELYAPIKNQTKYLDLVIPVPLLYRALYKKEILQDNGVHGFIYFTKQDSFATFYRNGEFIYSKSIEFSLEQLYDKFCEELGERVDKDEFYTSLASEGLNTSDNHYQQALMKIFGGVFTTINDVIIYVKRAFKLDMINQIFIGSVEGNISGLNEYSQNYFGFQSSDYNFKYNIENDEWYTDQLQYLMLLSAFDYIEDNESIVNLTIFPRPPSFVNRVSGQFIIANIFAISLGLVYPLIYFIGAYMNDAQIYTLNIDNDNLEAESIKYKTILEDKKKEIAVLDAKIVKLSNRYQAKTKTLTSIYNKKVKYRLKSATFHEISEELTKFNMNTVLLSSENDTFWLSLVSSDDRKFTEFIKYISEKYFNEIKNIHIDIIEKDKENHYYKGLLKVDLK